MLILILGGAGSGKSKFAEQMSELLGSGQTKYYLATMQVWDDECRVRIRRHQKQRAGKGFVTLECPCNLASLQTRPLDKGGTILLEDLGNLAANELYAPGADAESAEESILAGLNVLTTKCRHLVIVSNEVGAGGSAYLGDTALFLQFLGRLHQTLAEQADGVCEVVAGIPYFYKGGYPL